MFVYPLRKIRCCTIKPCKYGYSPFYCDLYLECGHVIDNQRRSECAATKKRCKRCAGIRGEFVSKQEMIQRLTNDWMAAIQEQLWLNVNSYYWRKSDANLVDGLHNKYRAIFKDGTLIGFDEHDSYGQGYRNREAARRLRWDDLGFDGVGVEV